MSSTAVGRWVSRMITAIVAGSDSLPELSTTTRSNRYRPGGIGLFVSPSTRTIGSVCTPGASGRNSGILPLLLPHPDVALDPAPRGGFAGQRAESESVPDPDLARPVRASARRGRDRTVSPSVEPARSRDDVARSQVAVVDPHALCRRRLGEIGVEAE